MAYTQNTVVVADNWKPELMSAVISDATAEGWTVIRNSVDVGDGYTRWVLESPATDFYAIYWCYTSQLNYKGGYSPSTANGGLMATVSEDYDDTTHDFTKPVVLNPTTGFVASSPSETLATTTTLASLWSAGNTGPMFTLINPYSSIPSQYLVRTTSTEIVIGTSSQVIIYSGLTDSLVLDSATNDPKPIVCAHIGYVGNNPPAGFASNRAGYTRSPLNGGRPAHTWGCDYDSLVPTGLLNSSASVYDLWQGGSGPTATRLATKRSQTVGAADYGIARATFPLLAYTRTGHSFLDQMTIGSVTYACVNSTHWIATN